MADVDEEAIVSIGHFPNIGRMYWIIRGMSWS